MLPHLRVDLRSPLHPDEAMTALSTLVSRRDRRELFRGSVRGRHFKVKYVFGFRKVHPVIQGEITPAPEGSTVRLTMSPGVEDIALFSLFGACGVFSMFVGRGHKWYLGLLLLAFVYSVFWFSFWTEANHARELFREHLACMRAQGGRPNGSTSTGAVT